MKTYLIEIIRLQDRGGNDTVTGSSLYSYIDLSKEDVLSGADGGGVGLSVDGEDGAVVLVGQLGAISLLEGRASTLGEVACNSLAEGRVSRASYFSVSSVNAFDLMSTKLVSGGKILLFFRGLHEVKV